MVTAAASVVASVVDSGAVGAYGGAQASTPTGQKVKITSWCHVTLKYLAQLLNYRFFKIISIVLHSIKKNYAGKVVTLSSVLFYVYKIFLQK